MYEVISLKTSLSEGFILEQKNYRPIEKDLIRFYFPFAQPS
jgi:hypothetical protein